MRRIIEPVRVAVVGLGQFGRLHALTLAGLVEAELVGLVARRQESLDALATELPDVPGWLDLDEAIGKSDAEAWVVASSTASHVPVTEKLLRAGKIVLLEKPIAGSLPEAEALASVVKSEPVNLMMGHIVLFNGETQRLLQEAREREIVYIDCVRHRPAGVLRQLPGETPLEAAMVHDLYVVQTLIGGAEPQHFSAQFHRSPDGIDLVQAQLQWSSGTLASLVASFLTSAGMPSRGFDRTEVFGNGWAARVTPNPRPIEIWDEGAHWPLPHDIHFGGYGPSGMIAEELRCFCRVVRGIQPVPQGASFASAMQVQRWMHRLNAAAA